VINRITGSWVLIDSKYLDFSLNKGLDLDFIDLSKEASIEVRLESLFTNLLCW